MRAHRAPSLFFSVRLPTLLAMFWRAHVARPKIVGEKRKGPLSFVVFRLDALGDVVLTTPVFRALKAAHPGSSCTVVVQKSYKSLLATNPHIDEILTLPLIESSWLPQGLRRLIAALLFYWTQLRRRHFDFAISPRWDVDEHLATFLCVMSAAVSRVGYSEHASAAKQAANRGFDRVWDMCLPPGPARHEVLRNLAVAEALGGSPGDARLDIRITESDRKRARRLLAKGPPAAKLVALGIGAQSSGRRWPLQRYATVIARLQTMHRIWPVIVCSETELGEALKLAALLREPPAIVSGARLRDVGAVLEGCALFIGNDSGCAHLAAAVGCRTLVVSRHPRDGDPNHFNSPVRFAPHARDVRVFQPPAGTDGCALACIATGPHCILRVSSDEVAAAAHQMLRRQGLTPPLTANYLDTALQALLRSRSAGTLQAGIEAIQRAGPRTFA